MSKHTVQVEPRDGAHSVVLCPHCGDGYIHLDEVFVAGRPREDGDIFPVRVDHTGHVQQGLPVVVPMGPQGAGRRHTITIAGWCEGCGQRVAFAFQQHKGETHLSTLTQAWKPAGT